MAKSHHYESHLSSTKTDTQHYYLTDQIESNRRVFYLFHAEGDNLQDLIERKSFSLDEIPLSETWLQKKINQFKLKIENQAQFKNKNFYSFSQLPYFKYFSRFSPHTEEIYSKSKPFSASINIDTKLWEATNEWNSQWEIEYGRWVNKTLTPSFMIDINLPSDCADVAYTLRWIFAYIHKLPMAVRLGGSNQLFTNETVRPEWLAIPTDPEWKKNRRFITALKYILNNTYTHTLMDDSYPVAINADTLTPGTHHLSLFGVSGHTMIIHKINEPNNLPITLLFSTTPIKVRELISSFYQVSELPKLFDSGFYKIRWAKKMASGWQLIPAKSIPGYSEEQFNLKPDGDNSKTPHFINVFKRLNPQFSFKMMLNIAFEELQARIKDRIQIVEDGYSYCQTHDCTPGSAGEEDWSTPSRDKRLLQLNSSIDLAASFLLQYDYQSLLPIKDLMVKKIKEKNFLINNKNYSLDQITVALIYQLTQTDPRLSVAERWGLSPSDGYGQTLIKTMGNNLATRKKIIDQGEECRQKKCDEYSESFKKFNTFLIDEKISTLWTGAQMLCQMSESFDCDNLKSVLQSQSFENKSYLDLYSKSISWNSNPNVSLAFRWGHHGSTLYFDSLSNKPNSSFFTKDHQWFTFNQSLMQASRSGLVKIDLPKVESLGQLHFESNHYFTFERSTNKLILRIYQVPHQPISEVNLNENETAPLRIWWSSPSKKTLSVFSDAHFYEIDALNGNLIQDFNYIKFHELSVDPRISIIETDHGIYMSDAEKDASHFIFFPLAFDDFKNVYEVQRSSLGWSFRTKTQFIYVESDSKTLIDWKVNFSNFIFINSQGDRIIKTDSVATTLEIYQRELNSGNSNAQFSLLKTMKGALFGATDTHFTIGSSNSATTYSLNTLNTIKLSCLINAALVFPLNENYYFCLDNEKRDLHYISGELIATDNNGAYWEIWNKNNSNSNRPWLNAYKYISLSSTNDSFTSYSEFYSMNPKNLEGPFLQVLNQDNFSTASFYLSSIDFPPTEPLNSIIAPPALPKNEFTNYGLTKPLAFINSFILKAALGTYKPKQILFLPNSI